MSEFCFKDEGPVRLSFKDRIRWTALSVYSRVRWLAASLEQRALWREEAIERHVAAQLKAVKEIEAKFGIDVTAEHERIAKELRR